MNELHEQNRRSWNHATARHDAHKVDQGQWLRDGGDTLFPEEVGLLGQIEGLRLAHLQCNAGQDTLSLVRRGAACTGVDISDEAIASARRLSAESGLPATFERADVYDWLDGAPAGAFDVVFSSYGALCWLSDLSRWARGIERVLVPRGRLVLVEFHPVAGLFDAAGRVPYLHDGPLHWDGIGDYVGEAGGALSPSGHRELPGGWQNPEPSVEWTWSLSQVVQALIDAGLRLEHMREYPYSNGCDLCGCLVEREGRRWWPPEELAGLPLMYSVVARR